MIANKEQLLESVKIECKKMGIDVSDYLTSGEFLGRPLYLELISTILSSRLPKKYVNLIGGTLNGIILCSIGHRLNLPICPMEEDKSIQIPLEHINNDSIIIVDAFKTVNEAKDILHNIRDIGGNVNRALAILDLENGVKEYLKENDVDFEAVFTLSDI